MRSQVIATGFVLLLSATLTPAQALRLRFQPGQVITYRVEHATATTETMGETKAQTKSLLKVTKRWQVLGVDKAGVATLQLSLIALAQERTTYSGEVVKYDSAAPEKSTPQMRDALGKYLNTPLATLRVDSVGRVIEVKQSKTDATGFENELPFLGVLPASAVKVGQNWEQAYKITLTPPLGTGQKYDAVRKFSCKDIKGDLMTVTMTTELKTAPKAAADQIPLWQMQPKGSLVYDRKKGLLQKAELTIEKEAKGHQGEGSNCTFTSTMKMTYVPPSPAASSGGR